jgi:NAD(P)H-hydrate epimerase
MAFKWKRMIEVPENLRSLDRNEIQRKSAQNAAIRLKEYDPYVHKGNRGHLAIIAGSEGMIGASILTTSSAARSGVGKITVFVPNSAILPLHLSLPDVIVKPQITDIDLEPFTAIAIGPGLGISSDAEKMLKKAISVHKPIILDADALNLLSQNKELLNTLPKDAILTPHLLEWKRLFGSADSDKARIDTSLKFCKKLNINILIKGHISSLLSPEQMVFYNGTGNSGMAKGGSGDVLTGLIGGLLAQKYTALDAAIVGIYIHGLAGDLASEEIGEDAMTATDQIRFISKAFKRLRNSRTNP